MGVPSSSFVFRMLAYLDPKEAWKQYHLPLFYVHILGLVNRCVKISVDEWILESTRPQKHA